MLSTLKTLRVFPRWTVSTLALSSLLVSSCSKDPSLASIQTDANGYTCTGCGAKYFTPPKVFMEYKCPKCQQFTLVEVLGYRCPRDQHVTLRPKVSGPAGASVCEKCGDTLKNALILPHEKELKAWGAVPAP